MKTIIRNIKIKGFSLLEVIIAIYIISVGIIAVINLMSYSMNSAAIGKSRIIATGLAQEGLEVIENIRDSNWFKDVVWNSSLDDCSNGCRVQYDSLDLLASSSDNLLIDGDGFYQYAIGSETLFERKITISDNPDGDSNTEDIKVISEVTWNERGKSYTISAETRLYNWLR